MEELYAFICVWVLAAIGAAVIIVLAAVWQGGVPRSELMESFKTLGLSFAVVFLAGATLVLLFRAVGLG